MQDDRFEWDDVKAESNRRKHGVTFEDARSAIDDPNRLDEPNDDPDEERWKCIGMGPNGILAVIYTERHGRYRIISARRATRHEQDDYHRQAQA